MLFCLFFFLTFASRSTMRYCWIGSMSSGERLPSTMRTTSIKSSKRAATTIFARNYFWMTRHEKEEEEEEIKLRISLSISLSRNESVACNGRRKEAHKNDSLTALLNLMSLHFLRGESRCIQYTLVPAFPKMSKTNKPSSQNITESRKPERSQP